MRAAPQASRLSNHTPQPDRTTAGQRPPRPSLRYRLGGRGINTDVLLLYA